MNERNAAYWDGSKEGKGYIEADERQLSERRKEGEGERGEGREREREGGGDREEEKEKREMSTAIQGL